MRVPDFDDLVEQDEANDTHTALDALDDLIEQHGREDDGRAKLEPDEVEAYLDMGGKRLYTPEARAERQRFLNDAVRKGDVHEVVYEPDGRVMVYMEPIAGTGELDEILTNHREDQRAARLADSHTRVSGWFS